MVERVGEEIDLIPLGGQFQSKISCASHILVICCWGDGQGINGILRLECGQLQHFAFRLSSPNSMINSSFTISHEKSFSS